MNHKPRNYHSAWAHLLAADMLFFYMFIAQSTQNANCADHKPHNNHNACARLPTTGTHHPSTHSSFPQRTLNALTYAT
eukprot:1158514-Pelagomonas_calceolata.AAC.7